ncbi:MAG: HEAT repeat domain-containing protein [Ignavibacteriales bacterium]|nr:HEAT repeat domain-containing protein [Ignavibacteriales bacterium]
MKSTNNTFIKKAVLTVLTVLVLASVTMGQSTKSANPLFKENAIKNLIVGIQSENNGLRESAIYLAGKYEITEVVETLVDQFKRETDPKMRVLIALALYKIGDEKGMDAIYAAAVNDSDSKVKRICNAIVNEYNTSKTVVTLHAGQ